MIGERFKDVTGQRFGSLTARWPAGIRGKFIHWLVSCDCGTLKVMRFNGFASGHAKSCGCLSRELASKRCRTKPPGLRHGHYRNGLATRTWRTWDSMIQRCTNQKATKFRLWGGRGITICQHWYKFENFLMDMDERPEGKTLDRYPDKNGNYSPGNCRWATLKEQRANRREVILKRNNLGRYMKKEIPCPTTTKENRQQVSAERASETA